MLTNLFTKGLILKRDLINNSCDPQECKIILFIDDDYVNFLYFKELLKNTNSVFIRTISYLQALHELILKKDISFIVLSSALSENVDNFVLKQLKSGYPTIPVITIIDDNTLQSEIEYLQSEGNIYINRYTDQDHFIAVMTDLLEEKRYFNKIQIS
jgi:DNA-binding NtrC family response regulator